MDLCLTSYVKKVPDPITAQHSRRPQDCRKVKDDQREGRKNKELAISQKVNKVPTEVKKCKKCIKRRADLRPSATNLCPVRSPVFDPYQTTFKRDFMYRPGSVAERIRPGSSNGYTYPFQLHDPIGESVYTNDYPWKYYSNEQPMRNGASSAYGRNNINKCQCLLLWKLLSKDPEAFHRAKAYFLNSMSSEDMGKVKAYQYNTIYRQDYQGIQQGFKMKCPPCLPNIHRMDQPCPPLTNTQYHYGIPDQKPELAVCTSRYGSNKQWDIAAKGIVPSVTQAHIKNQENRKQLTTYEREYGTFNMDFAKILKSLEPKAFQRYLKSLPNKGLQGSSGGVRLTK
ncbi:testis-expressed protein 26-like isoform X2 [Heterodontus francisci]|uniref:testis-expressed protein 26-like isoform X2 n=1 Tax=Heterodontus francisci TaxID=7792 RepID=UPI00355AF7C2